MNADFINLTAENLFNEHQHGYCFICIEYES